MEKMTHVRVQPISPGMRNLLIPGKSDECCVPGRRPERQSEMAAMAAVHSMPLRCIVAQ
jgi:hypothetical protein